MLVSKYIIAGQPDLAATRAAGFVFPRVMSSPAVIEIERLFNQPLADGVVENMAVNASVASPRTFQYQVPADKFLIISEINMILVDSGVSLDRFGGRTALVGGVIWRVVDGDNNLVYTFRNSNDPVLRTNADFYSVAGGQISIQPGDDSVTVLWRPITIGVVVLIKSGYKLQMVIRDDLSAMKTFKAQVFGRLIEPDFVQNV